MKRVIIAPILFIIILAICISTVIVTDNKTQPLIDNLNKLADYGRNGDKENAIELSNTIESQWDSLEKTYSFYIHHNDYETTAQAVSSIKGYAECGEMPELISECYTAVGTLEHIRASLKPTWGNIF